MNKVLSVTAIEKGTVIDHIPAGQAVRIIQLLKLASHKNKVTIGLNLQGGRGLKDLIKMENRALSEEEFREIAIFAPTATVSVIEDFKVVKKQCVKAPTEVMGLLRCPNPTCISNRETVTTSFTFRDDLTSAELCCHYCEKIFERDEMKEYVA